MPDVSSLLWLPLTLWLPNAGSAPSPAGPGPEPSASARPAGPANRELTEALAELASDSAQERRLAELWLARHVRRADFADLAAAARDGDPEVRSRIAGALGTDGRHLPLAALFAAEEPADLRAIGEAALHEQLLAWNPDLEECREVEGGVEIQLREAGLELPEELMRLDLGGILGDVVDRLLRTGAAGVPVVIDTDVDEVRFTRAGRDAFGRAMFEGTWLDLLMLSARLRNLDLEAVGLPSQEGLPAFLRFGPARSAGDRTGSELFTRWARELVAGSTSSKRRRAARALASTGWPPGIRWLEQLWTERDDAEALEGLLLAAGRGRVSPAFADPGRVRALLAGVDARLANGEPSAGDLRNANAVLHALANLSSLGAGGADLSELLLPAAAQRGSLNPAQLWFRLAVVEGQGSASLAVRDAGREILTAPTGRHPSPVLRQALATWVALPPPPQARSTSEGRGELSELELGDLAALLRSPRDADGARRLAEDLVRSGARAPAPAAGRRLDATDDRAVLAQLTIFEWELGTRALERAAGQLEFLGVLDGGWPLGLPASVAATRAEASADREALEQHRLQGAVAEVLRETARRGQAPRIEELLALLREREAGLPGAAAREREGEPAATDRLALLAGLLPPGRRDRVQAFVLEHRGASDGLALGVLAALPGGEEAREALLTTFQSAIDEGEGGIRAAALVSGLVRTLDDLRARNADPAALDLHGELLGLARAKPHTYLAATVLDPRWPPPPGAHPADLDALDTDLEQLFESLRHP